MSRAPRGAGRSGRGRRRPAGWPGSPASVVPPSRRDPTRMRRRYWSAARRMRDSVPAVGQAGGIVAGDRVEAAGDIGGGIAGPQRVTFLQQGGEIGGERHLSCSGAPPASSLPAAGVRRSATFRRPAGGDAILTRQARRGLEARQRPRRARRLAGLS